MDVPEGNGEATKTVRAAPIEMPRSPAALTTRTSPLVCAFVVTPRRDQGRPILDLEVTRGTAGAFYVARPKKFDSVGRLADFYGNDAATVGDAWCEEGGIN